MSAHLQFTSNACSMDMRLAFTMHALYYYYSVYLLCFLSSESLQVFGKENYISPRNSQQYFYKISPMTTIQVPNKVYG
jgi:hypothetical protein